MEAQQATNVVAAETSAFPGFTHTFDHTGQIAPPGMTPRVTATLWEDEGSLVFHVATRGVVVSRREDNHMINGTKLLAVAGISRGNRDALLMEEKTKHVAVGPPHLSGVWIPFERALELANHEKFTEMVYPLFVHDIGALLYHPVSKIQRLPHAPYLYRHNQLDALSPQVDRRRLALLDYQMELMLLEQQNKNRLLMAGQDQNAIEAQKASQQGGVGLNGVQTHQGEWEEIFSEDSEPSTPITTPPESRDPTPPRA